jgi:Zn finger protein HypA/HybF involved in hydrogenase expression
VKEVTLKVGALDVHSEESFRQAFEWLAKDTVLENARLHLVMIAPTLECPQCGYTGPCAADHAEGHDPMPVAECPGCGAVSGLHGARGVESIELVLSDEDG